jgi:hypothetical protein
MTPQQLKAMKLALEALEGLKSLYGGKGHKLHEINMIHRNHDTAITALEKVLAEHAMRETQRLGQEIEQEPVMWSDYESNGMHHKPVAWMDADGNVSDNNDHKCFPIPLYTTPPQRTEQVPAPGYCKHCKQYTIEEPLPPQPEQEPVAYMSHSKESFMSADDVGNSVPNWTDYYPTPLYAMPKPCPTCEALARTVMLDQTSHDTTPPQLTWVDLPDEEIKMLWIQYRAALPRYLCFAKALLARAKEKNT